MRNVLYVLVAAAALAAVVAVASGSGQAAQPAETYIVRMAENPVATYAGGIAGYKATQPARGNKINPNDSDVVKYVGYLGSRHDAALAKVGGATKLYDYEYTFNGFAARLTEAQASKLRGSAGILSVERDVIVESDTATTHRFLGLDAENGLWSQLGGTGAAGENVIVGVLDSGFWPEHPSFTDRTGAGPSGQEGKLGYQQIPGWHGKCVPGEAFSASDCNQKVIGAQYFLAGIGEPREEEFRSPRDYNDHGSHTASTAAGNFGVPSVLAGSPPVGAITGMAPRARLAIYKVCWQNAAGGCSAAQSDSVEAIDQAVRDGVDVINYSISGTQTSFLNSVEQAYFNAAAAGVFVATSAGNSGPAPVVAHPSPWLTTVGAATHNRAFTGSVKLGDASGSEFFGPSVAAADVGPAQIVYAGAIGLPGVNVGAARQCYLDVDAATAGNQPALDPAKAAGKIVVCDRVATAPAGFPANARVDKSAAVAAANGIGMVLANETATQSLNTDVHSVPTVHIDNVGGDSTKAYIASAGAAATAIIKQAIVNTNAPAPLVGAFSSRGPSAASGDQLKPDVTAPGVDIAAAVSPANDGNSFGLLSGTSMSSPHVAGLGALLKQRHPSWTPMMIKSALMTTASNLQGFGTSQAAQATMTFAQGAGHVRPNSAADPGLVFDSGPDDWNGFLCGVGQPPDDVDCESLAIDPSDLNLASMAIGDLAGRQTLTRTALSVGSASEEYTVSKTGLPGIDVIPSLTKFTVGPGQSQSFSVEFVRNGASLNAYSTGFITWSGDKGHVVRMPVAIQPVALAVPAEVTASGTGGSGSTSWDIKAGYVGALAFARDGLVPSTPFNDSVDGAVPSFSTGAPQTNSSTKAHEVTAPAGVNFLRFSIKPADVTDGDHTDLDVYVYKVGMSADPTPVETLTLVGISADGDSDEVVTLTGTNVEAGAKYRAFVHGFGMTVPSASYRMDTWALTGVDANNVNVSTTGTPAIGATIPVTASWTGLAPNRYLGVISYNQGTTTHAKTVLRIDSN
jgi:subtilisin family serine protease